jgi:hypothetical protein
MQTAQINISVNSKEAQQNVDKLTQSINNAGTTSASLKAQLRQITNELANLQPGSARFDELSKKAGQLRDTIQDTNAVINATAGNVTENFGKSLSNVAQIGVAGFQSVMAAQTLFGIENEDLQKTLTQFGALLNLTQAIETFGGLSDRLVQIKAGFTPLLTQLGILKVEQTGVAVATTAADAALVGESVAATAAAASTRAFGAALNAIPLIAVITALATLAYGIYEYASANTEAKKEEEKRKKSLEALNKTQKETTEYVAKESSEFTTLIYQLKATNEGSKRRKDLIKEINAQYGTTLKNLSDENEFQDQLNVSVKEYIALQYNKFKLQKNQDYIDSQNEKRFELERKLSKLQQDTNKNFQLTEDQRKAALGDIQAEIRFRNQLSLKYQDRNLEQTIEMQTLKSIQNQYKEYKKGIQEVEESTNKLGLRREQLTKVEDDLTKGGKVYVEQKEKEVKSTEDQNEVNEAYVKILEKIKDELNRQRTAEEELEKSQISRMTNVAEREIKTLEKQYGDERQELIDGAIEREISAFDEKFKIEGKTEEEYTKGIEEIRKKGADNLLEVEKKLIEDKKLTLDQDIENIKTKYALEAEIVKNSIISIEDETKMLELQFAKEREIREITNSTLTEEKKQEAILAIKKKYLDDEVKLIEKQGEDQLNVLKTQRDKTLQNEELTSDQRKEIDAKYNQDVLKTNQDTQDKIQEAIDGTTKVQEDSLTSLQKNIDKISQYVDKIAEIWGQVGDLISQRNEERFSNEERRIDGIYEQEKQLLENQLTEGVIAREQFDDKVKELDQQRAQEEKQLAMEKFQETKKLNIVNATIQGTQAVLAAYASGAATPIIGAATAPIYAAIAAAFAAAQVAAIANQNFTAAGGGIVPGIGSGMVDSVPSLLAPGETVINAESSAMYPELLNQVNMAGGGISLKPDMPGINKSDSNQRLYEDNKTDKPIRAYVVETDVTDTQKRIDRIKRSAEF